MGNMAKHNTHSSRGPSQRQLRVGELIRRTLSDILIRGDIHDPDLNRLSITVGEVTCSPDLKVATAYVLPLGGEHREEALASLRRNRHEIRRTVGKALTLKYIPDIRYEIDETFDLMDKARVMFDDEDVRRDVAGDHPDAAK